MKVKGMVTAVAVGGALTLGASMAAAPAYADTTGTVKARTQRTSAANLNSQTGWLAHQLTFNAPRNLRDWFNANGIEHTISAEFFDN
jgi:hypothetical protein